MIRVAYECYADEALFRFLRDDFGFPLKPVHSFSQGRVVSALLKAGTAEAGIVDEDPLSSHHSRRDRTVLVHETNDVEWRRASEDAARILIVVKPDLEKCFFAALKRVGLKSEWSDASTLHRQLAGPWGTQHAKFQSELSTLHRAATERNTRVFTRDIEDILRARTSK